MVCLVLLVFEFWDFLEIVELGDGVFSFGICGIGRWCVYFGILGIFGTETVT